MTVSVAPGGYIRTYSYFVLCLLASAQFVVIPTLIHLVYNPPTDFILTLRGIEQ